MTELVKYEAARRALAEAVAVDEVAEIRSKAEALRHYARQAGDKSLEIQSAQLRFRAERKMGELLAAATEAGQLRRGRRWEEDSNCSQSEQLESDERVTRVTLAQAGIDRKLSSRAQKLAAMDLAEFEQALARHKQEMESGAGRVAMDLLKIDAEAKGRVHRRDLASALSSASAIAPDGRLYPAGLGDPPWHRKAGIGNRAYENHYPTMPWPEILDYLKRAGEALLPDAWFWMWIPPGASARQGAVQDRGHARRWRVCDRDRRPAARLCLPAGARHGRLLDLLRLDQDRRRASRRLRLRPSGVGPGRAAAAVQARSRPAQTREQ
ncbi:hypothetical protein ACVWXO_008080 [Bradyrhizobium sp. LM2.7]